MLELKEKILLKIRDKQEISPFLFVWQNLELVNQKVKELSYWILDDLNVNKLNFFVLEDNWETIKIWEIKDFFSKMNLQTNDAVQIFFIENIWRFTLQAANSCLKIFEEPWVKNLIFLSNSWESWILETILSRVNLISFNIKNIEFKNNFFYELIDDYIKWKNFNLVKYFFNNKLEKQEYLDFLNTLFVYLKDFRQNILLEDLLSDIEAIKKSNLITRNVVDKWLLIIKNTEK
jgi:hypothetical protein